MLPTFVAVDLSRLPPIDVNHNDVSALLQEISILHTAVRAVAAVRSETDEVKGTLHELKNLKRELVSQSTPSMAVIDLVTVTLPSGSTSEPQVTGLFAVQRLRHAVDTASSENYTVLCPFLMFWRKMKKRSLDSAHKMHSYLCSKVA